MSIMSVEPGFAQATPISFLNRDHVVLVTVADSEIVVTTTLGIKVVIPVTPESLARFVDELANHVESNFVPITSTAVYVR